MAPPAGLVQPALIIYDNREFPGVDLHLFVGDSDPILDSIEEFVTGMRPLPSPDRFLGTVLFVDVVGSTQLAATIGDSRFAELLVDFIQLLRRLGGLRGCQLAIEVTGVSATHEIYESRYGLATMPARASSGMLRA